MPRKKQAKRDYGSGSVYKNTPDSKTWTVSWKENGKPVRKGGFGSKDEGQKFLDNVIHPNLVVGKLGLPDVAEVQGTNNLSAIVERWFETRKLASVQDERYNWKNHLEPAFGKMTPNQLDSIKLAEWVLKRLPEVGDLEDEYEGEDGGDGGDDDEEGMLAPGTVKNIVALVSTLYTDLIDQKIATSNPAKSLPRSVKRRLKSDHDPATTPFVRHLMTVFALIRILPEPINVAYAIGALAGLRTGEVLGLDWTSIDLDPTQRKITVRQQVSRGRLRRPKSKKSRTVLIVDALYPILLDWHRRTGGTGMLFKPTVQGWAAYQSPKSTVKFTAQWTLPTGKRKYQGGWDSVEEAEAFARVQQAAQPTLEYRRGGSGASRPKYMTPRTLHKHFDLALEALSIPRLTWYQATRHTFASQWVINRGDMKLLQKLMGHYSITTTERYARLAPDHFHEDDYRRLAVDTAFVALPAAARSSTAVVPGAPQAPPLPAVSGVLTDLHVSPGAIESYLAEPDKELAA